MNDHTSKTTDETDHLLASPVNAARLRQSIAQITALESLPTRVERLERENKRLRAAIQQIADLSPRNGGVGQIARDEMRLWK